MRASRVAASLRILVRACGGLSIEVELGPGAEHLPGLTALLRLATLERDFAARVTATTEASSLELLGPEGTRVVERTELLRPLDGWLADAIADVVSARRLAAIASTMATDLGRRDVVRVLAERVAACSDVDRAFTTLAEGIAAEDGLGFDRAAIFLPDRSRGTFVGKLGAGHDDIDARVRGVTIAGGTALGDEIALATQGGAHHFERPHGPIAGGLGRLDPAPSFALTRVATHDRIAGLLFADHRWSGTTVDQADVEALGDLAAATAVALEAIELRREVDELARQDSVTGLFNRRELEARFAQERSRVLRQRGAIAFLLLEIDPEDPDAPPRSRAASELAPADARRRTVGSVLRAELRAHDSAARFDGDELAVILPGAGSLEAALVLRRLGEATLRRGISLSGGAAAFPDDCDHPDDLVRLAEAALAEARAGGRGRACLSGGDEPIVFADG